MKTITIDISSILYWIILIYTIFNLITILLDSIDGDLHEYSLIQKLNPFRHGFIKYFDSYFITLLITIIIVLVIHFLIITPILTHHFEFIW